MGSVVGASEKDEVDVRAAKAALREGMRAVRSAIPEADRARRSEAAARLLLALPETSGARRVFTFLSFGSELSTAPAIAAFRERGVRVAVPVLDEERMEAVELPPGAVLVPTSYGAMEPAGRAGVAPEEIDLVVAPGLAFDRAGRRLGYGGGYFDAFLPRLRPGSPIVGVCFAEQLVDAVPAGARDRAVDVVVTDREVVRPPGESPHL
jgi:5-formyltetrahydrofolate cyclo-ligase